MTDAGLSEEEGKVSSLITTVSKLQLEYARPYGLCKIEPSAQINVLFGKNGLGKTTILEGIYIALTGKSFKSNSVKDFIQNNRDYSNIQLSLGENETRKILIKSRSKQLQKNGALVRSLSEFCQGTACVALIPEHIALINGSADNRRKYLDHMLFFENVSIAKDIQAYKKALAQKQSLLKSKLGFSNYWDQVQPWNQQLIVLSEKIREKRRNLLKKLIPSIQDFYQWIGASHTQLDIAYETRDSGLGAEAEEKKEAEHMLQRCLWGCHKDDIKLSLNGQSFSVNASQGERASCLLALKFAELECMQSFCKNIIILLDDIGGTLDEARRKILVEKLKQQNYQTFISTADKQICQANKDIGAKIYELQYIKAEGLSEEMTVAKWQVVD